MDKRRHMDVEYDSSEGLRRALHEAPRLGVTEFARSKAWRRELDECQALEVLDRNETVAYLVSPQLIEALFNTIDDAEELIDNLDAQLMFAERKDYNNWMSGKELEEAALALIDQEEDGTVRLVKQSA